MNRRESLTWLAAASALAAYGLRAAFAGDGAKPALTKTKAEWQAPPAPAAHKAGSFTHLPAPATRLELVCRLPP